MAELREQTCQDRSLKTHLPSCPLQRTMGGCNKTGQKGQKTHRPGQEGKEAREVGAEQKEPGKVIGQVLPKLQEGTKVRMQNPHTKRWDQSSTILQARVCGTSYIIEQENDANVICNRHPLKPVKTKGIFAS